MSNFANQIMNLAHFEKLLPSYFYDSDTDNRIMETVQNLYGSYFHGYKLDVYGRHFIPVPKNESNDKAWQAWQGQTLSTAKESDVMWKQGITYKMFLSGKDEKGDKIFKKAKKLGVIDQPTLDEINKLRDKAAHLWVCISRNPVDYILSPNDNSCLRLDSGYEKAYYMSVPALILDPYRCLVFLTDKKWKRVYVKGIEFHRYNVIQRAWGISCLLDCNYHVHNPAIKRFLLEKTYNQVKIEWHNLLEGAIDNSTLFRDICTPWFQLGCFEDGQNAMIYLDRARMEVDADMARYHWLGYDSGKHAPNFEWTSGFSDIEDFEDLTEGRVECCECGERVDERDRFPDHHGNQYCSTCFHESFSFCEHCEESCHNDDVVSDENRTLCSHCYRHNFFTCECCDNIFPDEENNEGLCESCYQETFEYCEHCHEDRPRDEFTEFEGNMYCSDCLEKYTTKCHECKDRVPDDEIFRVGDLRLCDTCYTNSLEACDECGKKIHPDDGITRTTLGTYCQDCLHENYVLDQTEEEYLEEWYRNNLDLNTTYSRAVWLRRHPLWKALEAWLEERGLLALFEKDAAILRLPVLPLSPNHPSELLSRCFNGEQLSRDSLEFWIGMYYEIRDSK